MIIIENWSDNIISESIFLFYFIQDMHIRSEIFI